jgi:hypothetical protein
MTDSTNAPGTSPIYAAARDMLDALGKGVTSVTATVAGSTQVAHMTDGGDYRVLTVDDVQPLHPDTLATWAAAVGQPAAGWRLSSKTGGRVARLEWATDGEARGEGSRITWIGGKP